MAARQTAKTRWRAGVVNQGHVRICLYLVHKSSWNFVPLPPTTMGLTFTSTPLPVAFLWNRTQPS
eukprot:7034835-Pyramimonas_sp.AAC.1